MLLPKSPFFHVAPLLSVRLGGNANHPHPFAAPLISAKDAFFVCEALGRLRITGAVPFRMFSAFFACHQLQIVFFIMEEIQLVSHIFR